jgi:uncharacterized protein (DUF2141 family)
MIARLVLMACFCWAGSVLASQPQTQNAPSLRNETIITIGAVEEETRGPLLVYLYNEKDSWLKLERSYRKVVLENKAKSEYRWVLKDLPAGEYAVQVIHDEDENGTLTMGMFGPSEGVGVSQYVPTFIPRFNKAKFKHNGQSTRVTVEMNY